MVSQFKRAIFNAFVENNQKLLLDLSPFCKYLVSI